MDNCGSDPLDLAQLWFPHLQSVKELDEHMTDDLRAWVTQQRDKEGRKLLIATVETFLKEASNKQIRDIYDLTLALNMRAANKEAYEPEGELGANPPRTIKPIQVASKKG